MAQLDHVIRIYHVIGAENVSRKTFVFETAPLASIMVLASLVVVKNNH